MSEKANEETLIDKLNELIAKKFQDLISRINVNNILPKASGNLQQSVEFNYKLDGTVFKVVMSIADYYKYLDEGRKPGKFPPIDKIKEWITIKPIVPQTINGITPTVNQLSYLIARKIALKGIDPLGLTDKINKEFKQIWNTL